MGKDNVWRNVRWLNDDIDPTGYGFLFGEFGEQAGDISPSTNPEYNTIIMTYFNKWLPLQIDRNLNRLNGEAIDWEDEENAEQCGDDYDGLYPELLHNLDKEIWITEYEPLLLDEKNLYLRPYQGGWPHAILFLYSTLGYITETSNLKVLINNNVNGFAGNYRLIDSYSYADNVNGTNQCRYICDGGDCNADDERDLCKNKYPFLSPKGELMRLLNQLAWENNQIEKINFGEDIGTTHIKRFGFSWNYYPKDLYGWKFSNNGIYSSSDGCLEANDHDYLFINVSENEYHISFDDCDAYAYQVKKSDNMFAKNYHHDNAAGYTTVPYPNQSQDDDVVFTWEFTEQSVYNNGGFFDGTDKISQDSGLINSNSEDSVLVIPPSSVVQVMYQGASNEGNCESLSVSEDIVSPLSFALEQPYPNPFNPTTIISFSIPEYGLTTIIAYDITGRQFEILTNKVLDVGNYTINWNATSYPSGIYLIRMESGDFRQTKKVVLVK